MIPWYISEYDVITHPLYRDEKDVKNVLHNLGMDVRYGYSDDGRHIS